MPDQSTPTPNPKRRGQLIAGDIEIPPDWHPERNPEFVRLMRELVDKPRKPDPDDGEASH